MGIWCRIFGKATRLHLAVADGDTHLIESCLTAGIKVDIRDKECTRSRNNRINK